MGEKLVKCDCCGAPAVVCLMQVANGSTMRINLCANCARERGVIDEYGAPTEHVLQEVALKAANNSRDFFSGICQACGFSGTLFPEKKSFGCPRCYETFSQLLDATLKRMHCGTLHKGKVPVAQVIAKMPQSVDLCFSKDTPQGANECGMTAMDLQVLMEYAIAQERYEDAAQLRDKLKTLTKKKCHPKKNK
ncbi:MAG: UvrB/UvrC motif-containing protein [Puniceicoccales bacterium]|jgi:protein arginine kinase activator|nr:UvrB/UvrC motif-containing protein [Puniceicoccales bacterium]